MNGRGRELRGGHYGVLSSREMVSCSGCGVRIVPTTAASTDTEYYYCDECSWEERNAWRDQGGIETKGDRFKGKEKDIVDKAASSLRENGHKVEREVSSGHGRCDLMVDDKIAIEVKRSRRGIKKAIGQCKTYEHESMILLPTGEPNEEDIDMCIETGVGLVTITEMGEIIGRVTIPLSDDAMELIDSWL